MAEQEDGAIIVVSGDDRVIHATGAWTIRTAERVEHQLLAALGELAGQATLRVDLSGLAAIDTAGAWLLSRTRREIEQAGRQMAMAGLSQRHRALFDRVDAAQAAVPASGARINPLLVPFAEFGRVLSDIWQDLIAGSAVQGRLLGALASIFSGRQRFRFASTVTHFDRMVFRAVPIICLISFLVGAIITQQSIFQLRNFGAAIFVVDLSAILMLREVGVLLTAIMIAGRSGSAITAELGSMRMREEVDALNVMGLDPYSVLILPRVIALVLGLPILSFLASMAGLVGAALVANVYGDIGFNIFIERLKDAIWFSTFAVGIIKAPFMAFIIGLVACIEGMKVEGSAESLGHHTTASVVKAIFMVIVADGLFAMFFAAIDY